MSRSSTDSKHLSTTSEAKRDREKVDDVEKVEKVEERLSDEDVAFERKTM